MTQPLALAPTLNVDTQEVDKFERAASRWWDPQGECKPLHQMNPVRANFIERTCKVAGKRLLDIGCGGGLLCEAMAQRGAEVTGLDMSGAALDVAKAHSTKSGLNIDYRQGTIETFASELIANGSGQFDVVTCLEMLEHVPDPSSVIQAATKVLKPGGKMVLSTLNRTAASYLLAIVGAEYIAKVLPKGTHDYKKFITPAEMASACREAGLSVEVIRGLSYNPLTQSFSESRRVDINYLLVATKGEQ